MRSQKADHQNARLIPDQGLVWYRDPAGRLHDVHAMPAPALRSLHRSDWGFVHQDPKQNLRMNVTAGGNVGERLIEAVAELAGAQRHQGVSARRRGASSRATSAGRWQPSLSSSSDGLVAT